MRAQLVDQLRLSFLVRPNSEDVWSNVWAVSTPGVARPIDQIEA